MSLRIAYIGPEQGTSLHRAHALERLGHHITVIDPWAWLGNSKWVGRWLHHANGIGVGFFIKKRLVHEVNASRPDLIWINQGEFLDSNLIEDLRNSGAKIVNYANDNPFRDINKNRFSKYKDALKYYDLVVVTFEENLLHAVNTGARKVTRVFLTADEIAHSPSELTFEDHNNFDNDVSYISQWTLERGPFIAKLIELGIPLSIWGDRWEKAKEWSVIKRHWRGPGIFDNRYAKAIQCSKISLCLPYKAAGNLHTNRSIEIPALGTLLCAERTAEHQYLYDEGKEAVFFSDAKECADICLKLLADEQRRMEIARCGYERALRNNLFNEPIMASIIEIVQST